MFKPTLSDLLKICLAVIAAGWLIYNFYLVDEWAAKHVNIDLKIIDAGTTEIQEKTHYYVTYKLSAENKSSKKMSFIFAKSQLSTHQSDIGSSVIIEKFSVKLLNQRFQHFNMSNRWSNKSKNRNFAFSFVSYSLDTNEKASEIISVTFPFDRPDDYIKLHAKALVFPTCVRNIFLMKNCRLITAEVISKESARCDISKQMDEQELCYKYVVVNGEKKNEISLENLRTKYGLAVFVQNIMYPFGALIKKSIVVPSH